MHLPRNLPTHLHPAETTVVRTGGHEVVADLAVLHGHQTIVVETNVI